LNCQLTCRDGSLFGCSGYLLAIAVELVPQIGQIHQLAIQSLPSIRMQLLHRIAKY
jgi:hypothetical protein